ncbi:MAG TPA: hypothetical protein VMK13_12250 [Streptosporangiaceae bacterium]|nr:hypothetical protein [Streptosporangiaceae bacterium]
MRNRAGVTSPAGVGHARTGRARPRRRLALRIAGRLSVAVVVVLTAGSVFLYAQYRGVWDSISRLDVSGLGTRPPSYNSALNVLVFGTDSRAGLSPYQQIKLHVGPPQESRTPTRSCWCTSRLAVTG